MKYKDYHVVASRDPFDFEKRVSERLREGWYCHGSMVLLIDRGITRYFQPMVLPDEE